MKIIKLLFIFLILVITLASFTDTAQLDYLHLKKRDTLITDTLKIDAQTGLIEDANLNLIKANCTGCHSTKLIVQHRFTREGWIGKIRWMQKNHNLWDLGESEKVVLDYLEKYYSPESEVNKIPSRRPLLKDIQWYKL
jgi:hypothetical protein